MNVRVQVLYMNCIRMYYNSPDSNTVLGKRVTRDDEDPPCQASTDGPFQQEVAPPRQSSPSPPRHPSPAPTLAYESDARSSRAVSIGDLASGFQSPSPPGSPPGSPAEL